MKPHMQCVLECIQDMQARLPDMLCSQAFLDSLGIYKIVLSHDLKERRGWRGEALWREGVIELDARDVSRFRSKTPYSAPNGKADMSPTGVVVHEAGHFYWFKHFRTLACGGR